jgi:DNA repair exonuclease SbcCD ATPase subunit
LEAQWIEWELQVQTLETLYGNLERDNQKLENMLQNSKTTISNLRQNLDEYKIALESNKEDTGYIVALFADAQNELQNIKEYVAQLEHSKAKLKNIRITTGVFTGAGVAMFFCADLIQDHDKVKQFLKSFGIGMAAAGGVSLGVSFIF